ncbi:hypothetical protein HN51_032561 [Arachis hypogaea]|uniref:EF-hand domain-containing protein n=1 Tax=Arachis hypogaea TaxID=3818 RepID=A0A445B463_ARAHY|nr:probable calcium-binding protein CML32 [Arachis hypogaea]QHO16900.1 putative calcium-binding protein [Arachis hypogaea]RYR33458.1 hypothetical protein Ahy_A10g048045 isoform D [Arachis hypogaea]
MGITEACSRFIVDFLQAFKHSSPPSSIHDELDQNHHSPDCKPQNLLKLDDNTVRALMTVFGMQNNGRIKKENARRVVEKLGLVHDKDNNNKASSSPSRFELHGDGGLLEGDEVPVEEVLGDLEDMSKRNELLHEAFKIFDEDGDGYIDAMELKRVLDCLGLDKGWDMNTIEKMVKVVDLNLDGKVDFGEFELMMG